MKRMFLLAAVLSSATFLVSCGGGGGGGGEDSMMVATEDLQLRVDATNGADTFGALEGESFVYENGVPDFETTTATQVDIVDAPATAAGLGFRISSDGNTATGTLEFGSCLFRITNSNYPSRLRVGTTIRIRDCVVRISTRGLPADGTFKTLRTTVTFNGSTANFFVKVRINANGTIIIKNKVIGICAVRPITGTGGF